MNVNVFASLLKGIAVVICLLAVHPAAMAMDHCAEPVARLVSLQGKAHHQLAGQSSWKILEPEANFCPGDVLRVAEDSRVAIVLSNETILRINQKSSIAFPEKKEESFSLLKLLHGVFHIFSHRPRSLKVVTPYVNGVVEGTEFLVQVDEEKSIITVYEGLVTAVNQYGNIQLASNQSGVARKGSAPEYRTVVKSRDGVDWTLYYPRLLDQKKGPEQQIEYLLSIGRVKEARSSLAKLLEDDAQNSKALALASIIETVANNREEALRLAKMSQELAPKSATANLALSYAQQASFNLSESLKTLEKAAQFNPENSLLKARYAELLLAAGENNKALKIAKEATATPPQTGLAQTILGFIHLNRVEIDEAKAAFHQALKLDPVLPLARLGLGLAKIRAGKLEEGRAEIEIAAALDPGNSLLRSYLGKAYYEEKRNGLSKRQYEIAKELDPADPTSWFYDAIRKQSENRPVEALHDLQKSITLNDNRAVYRSRLLLDNDLASRSASLGRIYSDLGFEHLARVEAWKSVSNDPTNYSAYRFLADTYATTPRHEIPRVSALLRAMLLQPLNVNPIQPQLAESNLAILHSTGPNSTSMNEYNPLFLRDRIGLEATGIIGSDETYGDEISIAMGKGKFSGNIGQYHYETDGIRENNDQKIDIYTAFFQTAISPDLSLMAEVRHREREFGDIIHRFDPRNIWESIRNDEKTRSARLGSRYDLSANSTIIATIIASSDYDDIVIDFGFDDLIFDVSADNRMAEIQHIYRQDWFNLQSGAGFMSADEETILRFPPPFEDFSSDEESETDHTNLYSYAQIKLPYDFQLTLGTSGDLVDSPTKDREEINPKLGLTWQPTAQTLIRTAWFRTVTRNTIYAQTIEPTTIAGFNQFIGDNENSASEIYGVGIDHSFSPDIHAGAQYYQRDLDSFLFDPEDGLSVVEDTWEEDIASAYLYWTPANWISLGLEYYHEQMSRWFDEGFAEIIEVETHRITPSLRLFSSSGLSGGVDLNFVDQEGKFGNIIDGYIPGSDSFLVVNLSASYRLPRRHGLLSVEIKNLFDENFKYVNTDPHNPNILPEQQFIARLTFTF